MGQKENKKMDHKTAETQQTLLSILCNVVLDDYYRGINMKSCIIVGKEKLLQITNILHSHLESIHTCINITYITTVLSLNNSHNYQPLVCNEWKCVINNCEINAAVSVYSVSLCYMSFPLFLSDGIKTAAVTLRCALLSQTIKLNHFVYPAA